MEKASARGVMARTRRGGGEKGKGSSILDEIVLIMRRLSIHRGRRSGGAIGVEKFWGRLLCDLGDRD